MAAGTEAIQAYNGSEYGHRVEIFNNILDGATENLRGNTGNGQRAEGGGHVLVHDSSSGNYQSEGVLGILESLFIDHEARDLRRGPGSDARDAGRSVDGDGFDRRGWSVEGPVVDVGAYVGD